MQYLFLTLLLLSYSGYSSAAFQVNDKVYLNACGGNPQEYQTEPKVIDGLVNEVPNTITSLKKSPYGRPFTSSSSSDIMIGDETLTVNVSNFRDLEVKTNNHIIYKNKVSGATSIYELKHQGKVFAWGVGWHKQCEEYYENTIFTVLRVIFPVREAGKIKIVDKLFSGAFISGYEKELSRSITPIIMESTDIYSSGATSCYYCLPKLYGYNLDKGLTEITKPKELHDINIKLENVNPIIYASWLAQYGLKADLFSYIGKNFESIYHHKLNFNNAWAENLNWIKIGYKQQRDQCIQEVVTAQDGADSSISALGWACFPALQYLRYFEDLTRFGDNSL